jgi:RNA polymerase sigma factor (TIGR02999 family)
MGEITAWLHACGGQDDPVFGRIGPAVYGELRRLARSHMRRIGAMTLLDTTGLVHEAYLRLQDVDGLEFPDRKRFMAYASQVMRALAVDAARSRHALKRGGGQDFVTLATEPGVPVHCTADDVLRVHEALEALARADERLAHVVEMRYFGGLSEAEVADCLDVTERTVQREWRKARLFLLTELRH